MSLTDQVWFRTDEAWDALPESARRGLPAVDVKAEARGLRFITSVAKVDAFEGRHGSQFRPYTLYGSGDFHHLSALWIRQFAEPFVLLSFDNHPDWDIRPPRWSCGAWINRALENPYVQVVGIWGCGNFECNFPGRLLGNGAAAREGRLLVHPWAREGRGYPTWLRPLTAETWRSQFLGWLDTIRGQRVYITIDLDCLTGDAIFTNWEQGRFRPDDLVWALDRVRENSSIIGGDLCGAWSHPRYDSTFQKFAGWFDHPKLPAPDEAQRGSRLEQIFSKLWPALTQGSV